MIYSKDGGDDEMQNLLKNMSMERRGKPLEVWLWRDQEFMKSREQYHKILESLKKELETSQEGDKLVLSVDDAVGDYSGHYGDVAYVLGFHDGLEIGIEHGKRYGEKSDIKKVDMDELTDPPSMD